MSSIYGPRISIGVHSSTCLKPTHVCCPLTRTYNGILRRLGVWFPRPSNECRLLTIVTCSMHFSIRDEVNREADFPLFITTAEQMVSCCVGKTAEPANTCAAACLSSMWTDLDTAEPSERKNS